MTENTPNLNTAYALTTPEDSVALYANWAADYDQTFATAQDYQLHIRTAQAFCKAGGHGPVLDVGTGTGLCAAVLADMGVSPIDGTDISPQMLEQAREKHVFRALFPADITKPLSLPSAPYRGIVSSGTFTHGHVGPQAIDVLLALAAPGAIFALSINAQHYQTQGFAEKLSALGPQISDLKLHKVAIYGPRAAGSHKDDLAMIACFSRT